MELSGIFKRGFGAVKSGNKIAFKVMAIKILLPITRLVDALFSFLIKSEKFALENSSPAIMIVSPPRGGATLIYQVITRMIPSEYFSNMHVLFPSLATKTLSKFNAFGCKDTSFRNYYGYTSQINDVYEANEFVDPLFENNPNEAEIRNRFQNLMNSIRSKNDRLFIFKNARNYNNILKLHEAVPEVKFVIVRRNLSQVIQSELRAHYELGTFHPIPEELKNTEIKDPLEFVVRQITSITSEINRQLAELPKSSYIVLEYEQFCGNPLRFGEKIIEQFNLGDKEILRTDIISQPLKASRRKKVTEEEAQRIEDLLKVVTVESTTCEPETVGQKNRSKSE